jgi:chemotaxis receptor (MCP) glutamine deamidase CheD
MKIVLGIGEYAVSDNEEDVLKTFSFKHGDHFRINEKNVNAVKSILAKYFIYLQNEETGGTCIRNVEADVATGTIKLGRYSQQG